jgi:hypothetical protein
LLYFSSNNLWFKKFFNSFIGKFIVLNNFALIFLISQHFKDRQRERERDRERQREGERERQRGGEREREKSFK